MPSHDGASMGVFITEHGASFFVNNGGISWLLIVTKLCFIVAMLVVVVGGGNWHSCIVMSKYLLVEVVGFWIVRVRPQLGSSSCLPHCSQNLSLVWQSRHCYFLHGYVYIDSIHSCEANKNHVLPSRTRNN
ncbi:hypothetical protein OIU84_002553 [Salix udensis]|uniref:Transmembrane protein n=1 Tax=Salix udensis TaxID=889485 RepID=A0AAD6K4W8_9ROSI|nr:hypothetical protein OIU84_002553 [Salix udensis]